MNKETGLFIAVGILIAVLLAITIVSFKEQRDVGDAFCNEMDYIKHSEAEERYKELDEEIFIKCEKIEDGQLIEDYVKANQETRYKFKETKEVIQLSIMSIPILFLLLAVIPISWIRGRDK